MPEPITMPLAYNVDAIGTIIGIETVRKIHDIAKSDEDAILIAQRVMDQIKHYYVE